MIQSHIAQGVSQLKRLAKLIEELDPSKEWLVGIERHHKRRTTSQNKLLWAIYTEIATQTGHDPEEIHEYAKARFLPKRFVTLKGADVEIPGSTALLAKHAFSEYVERVASWAATDLGIQVIQ